MTKKEDYIKKKQKELDLLQKKASGVSARISKKNDKKELKKEFSDLKQTCQTAQKRLTVLEKADVKNWEPRRIKLRDSLISIKSNLDEMNIKLKNTN